jgi:hypothetical protein
MSSTTEEYSRLAVQTARVNRLGGSCRHVMTWTASRGEHVQGRRDCKHSTVVGFDKLPASFVNHPVMAITEQYQVHQIATAT